MVMRLTQKFVETSSSLCNGFYPNPWKQAERIKTLHLDGYFPAGLFTLVPVTLIFQSTLEDVAMFKPSITFVLVLLSGIFTTNAIPIEKYICFRSSCSQMRLTDFIISDRNMLKMVCSTLGRHLHPTPTGASLSFNITVELIHFQVGGGSSTASIQWTSVYTTLLWLMREGIQGTLFRLGGPKPRFAMRVLRTLQRK